MEPISFPPQVFCPRQRKVLKSFLMRNPDRRLGYGSGDDVLKDPFFADFDSDALLERRLQAPTLPAPQEPGEDLEEEYNERYHDAVPCPTEWDVDF